MSIIKNLKTDENGWFANGTFTSKSLFKGEMKVCIFIDAPHCGRGVLLIKI